MGRRLEPRTADAAERLPDRSRPPVSPRLASVLDVLPRRLPRRGRLVRPPKRTDANDGVAPRWAAENEARSLRPGAARYGGASYPAPLSLAAVVVPNAVRAAEPLSPPPRGTLLGCPQGGGCSRRRPSGRRAALEPGAKRRAACRTRGKRGCGGERGGEWTRQRPRAETASPRRAAPLGCSDRLGSPGPSDCEQIMPMTRSVMGPL